MTDRKLRQAIAAEAARLLQHRKELDYHAARRKAARWYSRQRVRPADMPSFAEIQQEVYALAGLFSSERQQSALTDMRLAARDLLEILQAFQPRVSGPLLQGPVLPGAQITLHLETGDPAEVSAVLLDAGHAAQFGPAGELTFFYRFPTVVWLSPSLSPDTASTEIEDTGSPWAGSPTASSPSLDLAQLDELLERYSRSAAANSDAADEEDDEDQAEAEDDYHPDFFPTVAMLLNSLEAVRLDPSRHPEGDLLYHTLQVYELGLAERPYDEEFLLACLLHDAGLVLDRRRPLEAIWRAVGEHLTDRTWFFIESLPEAIEYLSTGKIRGALRRSEDFEDLVFLAQCDLKGRVRGATVGTAEDALDYVSSLGQTWDDL